MQIMPLKRIGISFKTLNAIRCYIHQRIFLYFCYYYTVSFQAVNYSLPYFRNDITLRNTNTLHGFKMIIKRFFIYFCILSRIYFPFQRIFFLCIISLCLFDFYLLDILIVSIGYFYKVFHHLIVSFYALFVRFLPISINADTHTIPQADITSGISRNIGV